MMETTLLTRLRPLPLEEWEDTKTTLHLYFQIAGKIKLALNPWKNHWWQIPLFVTARGLDTGPVPYKDIYFQMYFDFIDHRFVIETSDGSIKVIMLYDGLSVADFYNSVFDRLRDLDIQVHIQAKPYKMESDIPFAEDFEHRMYQTEYVSRYWQSLTAIDRVFKEFSGRFYGKTSPVQLYWHSMDLTVTRFSGRSAEPMKGASAVEKEAYSREVISFGFWPGDPEFRKPAFYSYTWPSPDGLDKEPLKPQTAYWQERNGSPMALYDYTDWIDEKNPGQALSDFLESAFQAGKKLAGWKDNY